MIYHEHLYHKKNVVYFKEPTLDNLQKIAHALAKRAVDNGNDPKFYSPFAKSAKKSLGINICGMLNFNPR